MINIKNVTFAYPKQAPIFDGLNFQVKPGLLFGLLGPNGAGKTTLISLISGLIRPHNGIVKVNDKEYKNNRISILQQLSMVPQEYAFYLQLTAYENLNFFCRFYPSINNHEETINKALELTGLESYRNRKTNTYSGGLKRRLNLAIGLLNKPKLLILDEPTVGIDPHSRHFILQTIQALNEQGTTIIYTSHYMDEIQKLCDYITIMDQGKIIASGSLDDLLQSDSIITINTNNKINPENINKALKGFITQHSLVIKENILSGSIKSQNEIIRLLQLISDSDIEIENIQYGRKTLESLFFDLTQTELRKG